MGHILKKGWHILLCIDNHVSTQILLSQIIELQTTEKATKVLDTGLMWKKYINKFDTIYYSRGIQPWSAAHLVVHEDFSCDPDHALNSAP